MNRRNLFRLMASVPAAVVCGPAIVAAESQAAFASGLGLMTGSLRRFETVSDRLVDSIVAMTDDATKGLDALAQRAPLFDAHQLLTCHPTFDGIDVEAWDSDLWPGHA